MLFRSGFLLFLGMMTIVFQALFTWSGPAIDLVESVFGSLARAAQNALPAGILRDFLTEGLITGVGSVVVFLPQILLLFLFIGLMEDTGYMARVACLMDRVMRAVGLNGRAFVPMMSGFACAIPAILATRTMERRRDRYLTMMVIPLMTCSARLPVYTLIIGALFPVGHWLGMPLQGLLMAAMYLFSVLVALLASAVLSRTLFTGPSVPLLLELPPYRRPHIATVLRMMWQRSSLFLKEAGGVILVVLLLAGGYYFFVYEGAVEKPGEATAVTEPATAEPEAPPSAEEAQDPSVPTFSVVRVDKDGSTVAAGRALPGADVQVKANGEIVAMEIGRAHV